MRHVQDDKPVEHLAVVHGKVPRHVGAPVMADDGRPLRAGPVRLTRRRPPVSCSMRYASTPLRLVRQVVAAHVGREDAISCGRKRGNLVLPREPGFREAVKQDDERPSCGPPADHVQADARRAAAGDLGEVCCDQAADKLRSGSDASCCAGSTMSEVPTASASDSQDGGAAAGSSRWRSVPFETRPVTPAPDVGQRAVGQNVVDIERHGPRFRPALKSTSALCSSDRRAKARMSSCAYTARRTCRGAAPGGPGAAGSPLGEARAGRDPTSSSCHGKARRQSGSGPPVMPISVP